MSSNTILVFSENPALLQELLGEARRQASCARLDSGCRGLGKRCVGAG